jgi:hypothetical protein
MGTSVVGLYFGAGRTMMPILLFGSLMLLCPGPQRTEVGGSTIPSALCT